MPGRRWLFAAGAAGFLFFLLLGIPARLLTDALGLAGVRAGTASGTVWAGEVSSLSLDKLSLGRTSWSLRPARLLLGRLAADIETTLPGGFLRGTAEVSLGGRLILSDAEAAAALAGLGAMLNLPLAGGEATARITQFVLTDGWPETAVGEVRIGNVPLTLPGVAAEPGAQGSFIVSFDAPDLGPGETLNGTLKDLGGALELAGSVALSPPNNYSISGRLRPRPEAPQSLTQGLVLLGPEDAEGRREFALSGSL